MLWQVKSSGLCLFGSVHVLDVPPLPLNAAGWAAFGAATRVLFEHDLTQAPDMGFAQLKQGESLSSIIPAALYASVEDRCREWSINIVLVVAGALHMVGPTGLPKMLRQSGHEVIAADVTDE